MELCSGLSRGSILQVYGYSRWLCTGGLTKHEEHLGKKADGIHLDDLAKKHQGEKTDSVPKREGKGALRTREGLTGQLEGREIGALRRSQAMGDGWLSAQARGPEFGFLRGLAFLAPTSGGSRWLATPLQGVSDISGLRGHMCSCAHAIHRHVGMN